MLVNILNYFRIKDWTHILGVPTLGFVYNANSNLLSMEFVSMLFVSSLGLAFAYSFDTNYDKFKSKLLPSLIVLIAGIIYAKFLSLTTFFLSVIGGLIAIAYVMPPLRLKSIPILVTMTNSIGFALFFLVGYSIASDLNMNAFLLAIFVGIIAFPIQLVHELAHFSKDKKKGLSTTPIKFGKKFTYFLILTSLFILIIWSFFLQVYINFSILFTVFSIIFSFLFLLILKYKTDISKSRVYIRYLSAAFGLVLLFTFVFKI